MILILILLLIAPSAFAQTYTKEADKIVESTSVERKFTVEDIDKNLAQAQMQVEFYQQQVEYWQSMQKKASDLGVIKAEAIQDAAIVNP